MTPLSVGTSPPCNRWTEAKLFHGQLSLLVDGDQNVEHLRRLEAKIQEGVDSQVDGAAAEASRLKSMHQHRVTSLGLLQRI